MIKINVGRDCLCWETSQLIEGYGPIDWVVYDYSTDPDNDYLGSGLAIFMTDSGNLYRLDLDHSTSYYKPFNPSGSAKLLEPELFRGKHVVDSPCSCNLEMDRIVRMLLGFNTPNRSEI